MKKFLSGFCATAMAATFAISSIAPVAAAPIFIPKAVEATTDIQLANHNPQHRRLQRRENRQDRREVRRDRRQENRQEARQERRQDNRQFRREGNYAWYNNQRGYRTYRRGYRQHNGFWFPAAAFIAGALITGAIVNNNNNYGNAHVSYCYDRYRSYRAYDNTFQPYNGPRQLCYSPYS